MLRSSSSGLNAITSACAGSRWPGTCVMSVHLKLGLT